MRWGKVRTARRRSSVVERLLGKKKAMGSIPIDGSIECFGGQVEGLHWSRRNGGIMCPIPSPGSKNF